MKATLSIFSVSGSNTGYDVHAVTDTRLAGRGDHIRRRAGHGRQSSVHRAFETGTWAQVDVTSAVTGTGTTTSASRA